MVKVQAASQFGFWRWLLILGLWAVIFGILVKTLNAVMVANGYRLRPHPWIFQNPNYYLDPDQQSNIIAPHLTEIFELQHNADAAPNFGETDPKGFRLASWRPTTTRQRKTIITIGDSFTYGHGLRHEQTWQARLELQLAAKGQQVRVENAGVPGSATDQQFIRIKRLIATEKPDLVVWMLNLNDISETADLCLFLPVGEQYWQLPAWLNLAYQNALVARLLPDGFVETPIGNALTTRTYKSRQQATMGCAQVDLPEADLRAWYQRRLQYFLAQLHRLSEKTDTPIALVIAPTAIYFDERTDIHQAEFERVAWLQQVVETAGWPVLNLNESLGYRFAPEVMNGRLVNQPATPIAWHTYEYIQYGLPKLAAEWFFDEGSIQAHIAHWHPNPTLATIIATELQPIISSNLLGLPTGPACWQTRP